jgi:hypothetical protein
MLCRRIAAQAPEPFGAGPLLNIAGVFPFEDGAEDVSEARSSINDRARPCKLSVRRRQGGELLARGQAHAA